MRKIILATSLSVGGLSLAGIAGLALAAAPTTRPAPATTNASQHPAIVHVVSQDKTITISSGPDGLLYSLVGAGGKVMLADASGEDFARLHPELYHHIRNTIAVQNDQAGAWAGCD